MKEMWKPTGKVYTKVGYIWKPIGWTFTKANAFIAINDEPISWEIDATYYDPEGDILILEGTSQCEPLCLLLPIIKNTPPGIRENLKLLRQVNHSLMGHDLKDAAKVALIKDQQVPQASHRYGNSLI
ncbi:hypothetical protein Tco_0271772 [Tanacetum coccineum]